ncbi:MAG: hypothetical protein GWM98_00420, partial [Nitrospinaceae bacterium]|nr:glycosyltransferase family 9 protein [Nitrospinaceae bacterium]NIR53267.1 glycosyltransferase family 9 protein [Nitrospinaceae bacterium]NIS83665.1 glycosyltransferase family 9 protein [Nitrospinaceae bacterium]NIT80454.1 glycosyltransferase family 9 protein [Nitrospinaceae bacterium]NIU42792.1 glycosyltransferase family 9 protein [Nitrospinaceae bacterium]
KKSFPGANLDLLVLPPWKCLFAGNPHVSRVWEYHPSWYRQPVLGFRLRRTMFDAVLIFHANKDFRRLLPWLRSRQVLAHQGFDWLRDDQKLVFEGIRHGIEKRWLLIEQIGARPDGAQMELFFTEDEAAAGRDFLQRSGLSPGRYIYLNVGASGSHRRWPADRFTALAQKILDATSFKIVLGGGPAETPLIRDMTARGAAGRLVHTLPLNLKTDGFVIGQARLLVTCDTGPMHLGFALKVPTVALFGSYDPRETGPFHLKPDRCVPVYPGPDAAAASGDLSRTQDLQTISVSEVWNRVGDALSLPGGH